MSTKKGMMNTGEGFLSIVSNAQFWLFKSQNLNRWTVTSSRNPIRRQ